MSLKDELIAASTSAMLAHMNKARKVHFEPHVFIPPPLPSPPSGIQIPHNEEWPASFKESIDKALDRAWAPATLKNYSHSIKTFLAFCAKHHIPDGQIFPSSDYLICAFVASQSETVAQSTIKNYISGIRAWHIRNGYAFSRSDRLNLLARATRPLANKKAPRPPVSIEMLLALALHLKPDVPFDACVLACATTAFWGLARLGELLPCSYNYDHHTPPFPTPASISNGSLGSLQVRLPWTKVKKWTGETIFLAKQDNTSDPVLALNNHLSVNNIPQSSILFTFKDAFGTSVLLKTQFLDKCNQIWKNCGLSQTSGHSFRIGGTSHLLICGVSPDIIKKSGRWSSDSFLRYWRNLDIVIPKHTSRLHKTSASGPSGEPCLGHGCGLPPPGLAAPDVVSPAAGPSKDGTV